MGKQNASNNFARGYYNLGKNYIDHYMDLIRKLSENSDKIDGFLLNFSTNGGTGSGVTSLILEELGMEY